MNAPSAVLATVGKRRRLDPSVLSDAQIAFDEFLDANFFGQKQARKMLRVAYANYLNPLRDKNKPIGFFVFAGESRTGKTHGARMIPQFVHGNAFALLKINCSEYMDKHSLWNLKGSPRGHISNQVQNDEKYQNVPKDQKHGYCELMNHNLEWSKKGSEAPLTVVLLDEWDKACFDFNLLMLQAMDDGQLTLGSGEVVDFRNTIFIAACNSGMHEVEKEEQGGIGFHKRDRKLAHSEVESIVNRVIKENTPPEFRNRLKELGGIAVFDVLTEAMMKKVVQRDFKALQEFITASGYFFTLEVTDEAVNEVLRQALANNGNLSNVKSLITTEIQIPLGLEAIKKTIKQGDNVRVNVELPEGIITPVDAEKPVDMRFVIEASDPIGLLIGVPSSKTPAESVDGLAGGSVADALIADAGKTTAAAPEPKVESPAGADSKDVRADLLPRQSVCVQDFLIVLRAADNQHPQFKEALFTGLGSSPMIKVNEELTQYGDTANIGGVVVKINITTVKVLAPMELMFSLKRSMPFLDINTIASPLEL